MGLKRLSFLTFCLLGLGHLSAKSVLACPEVNNFIDYNCDRAAKFMFTGDSVVRGIGDVDNKNKGGYVLRLAREFRGSRFTNLGVAGVTTDKLLKSFKQHLVAKDKGNTNTITKNADVVFIDFGRNDYFRKPEPDPALTVRNIKRLVKVIRDQIKLQTGVAPFVVVSTLLPTRREFQKPFIDEVNRLLLKQRGTRLPLYIRFDGLDAETTISSDGIHPTPEGYDAIEAVMLDFLANTLPELLIKARPDLDRDGIYDALEKFRFGTDKKKSDSDEDGLEDGAEVFKHETDPLEVDTDGDGFSDGNEVTAGSDPKSDSSVPTPVTNT